MTSFPQSYWNLIKLTEILLHHCEKNQIIVWAEFGSLLGLKRHGQSIIPWDYDGDFGMMVTDKKRFLESFIQETKEEIVTDINYYNDEGCLAFFLKEYPDDIIDIIFYEETEDIINSLQNNVTKETYPSNDNYSYQKNDFYPLSKELMLGHFVYVPHNWEKILVINYDNWKEYPTEFQNFINAKFLKSPFRSLPEYIINDFNELKKLVETSTEPFILSNTSLLSSDQGTFEKLISNQTNNIYGYQSSISWTFLEEPAGKVWSDFLKGNLTYNVVDSPIDDKSILPDDWNAYVKNKFNNCNVNKDENKSVGDPYQLSLCWVMTNSPKITHFHTDPEYAGGYMKLLSGEKIWWCISPEDYNYLCSKGHSVNSMAKLSICELMQLENNYLFGKIYVNVITNEDLIWFPINTLHKVITTQDSYGFGGYL